MNTENYAEMTTEVLTLKEGTKTVYVSTSKEIKSISEVHYNNMVNSSKFFRNLGGIETHQKGYTYAGYKTVKLTSKSPCRTETIIRTFNFDK
jgi:hypothetical protein